MPKSTHTTKPDRNRVRSSPLTAELYTDGSHRRAMRQKGWAAVFIYQDRKYVLSGVADPSTDATGASNPTMELRAAAASLERLREVLPPALESVIVLSDFTSVQHYGNNEWSGHNAKVPHFRAEAVRLQKAAGALRSRGVRLLFKHVRAHTGVPGNELADALAYRGATRDTFSRLERYKTAKKAVEK